MANADENRYELLDDERRESIRSAAVNAFGTHGYKGARTADIAHAAGMSKGSLFFYFRNKRSLYEFAVDATYEKAASQMIDDGFWEITDFFDRMTYLCETKREVIDAHPRLLAFSLRAFYPSHRDARGAMGPYAYGKIDEMLERFFSGVDYAKFKEEVDPRYVVSMMVWLADGWMHERIALGKPISMSTMLDEFRVWCSMLRTYAYKQESL